MPRDVAAAHYLSSAAVAPAKWQSNNEGYVYAPHTQCDRDS